jgi:hypothetical protein
LSAAIGSPFAGNPVGQIKQFGQPILLRFAKFFNPYPSIGSADHPTNGNDHDITQAMLLGSLNAGPFTCAKIVSRSRRSLSSISSSSVFRFYSITPFN